MKRREFILTSALASLHAQWPSLSFATSLDRVLPLEQAAAEAYLYGLMLIENAAARSNTLSTTRPNTLVHARNLTTPKSQSVTTPNNDTLYSRAWIDLAAGPVTVVMPDVGDRYVSYAFMDMFGNNFAVLGSRTTGGSGGTATIVGPQAATSDASVVRSPTRWVWLLIRLLVDDAADLPAANALQDRMQLRAPKASSPPVYAKRNAKWNEYFSSVQSLLIENRPPYTDAAFFKRIAALGLGANGGFDAKKFSAAEATSIEAGIQVARRQLASVRGSRAANGWTYPRASLGNFGQDYLYRAQVALSGLAALPPIEAMYMRPIAPDGTTLLSAAQNWRLHFDKNRLPPLDAFWSLTMYEPTADGQFYFFDNPIDRYAIGDRTKGLQYNADGSLDIWMTRADPGEDKRANWLPLPRSDKFAVVFRAYLPRAELLDGNYVLPALQAQ